MYLWSFDILKLNNLLYFWLEGLGAAVRQALAEKVQEFVSYQLFKKGCLRRLTTCACCHVLDRSG